MKKYLVAALLICFLFAGNLFGQQVSDRAHGIIGFHYQQTDMSLFNDQAKLLGIPTLPNFASEFSGGYADYDGRWRSSFLFIIGGAPGDNDLANGSTTYQLISLGFGVGINVLKPESTWFIGPNILVQFRGEQVIYAQETSLTGIASAVNANYFKLTRFGLPLDAGLLIQKKFLFKGDETKFMTIGLKGGYRLDANPDGWRVDQAVNLNNTGINASGFFGEFQIGISFYDRKRNS